MNEQRPYTPAGQSVPPPVVVQTLATDLLRGAKEISEFVFGTDGESRKVYHLVETSRIPIFRLGSLICARKSVLMSWIASQEQRGM